MVESVLSRVSVSPDGEVSTNGRVALTFAGVTFSGHRHSATHVTVPVPAFKKMLRSGKVMPRLCYDIEHDGNGSNDRFGQSVDARAFCESALKSLERMGRPWLLYLAPASEGARVVLHYCPHSNLSYTLVEVAS